MKSLKNIVYITFLIPLIAFSQTDIKKEQDKKKDKPQRDAFEGYWLIDNPTNVLYTKGTLEFDIEHRFGLLNTDNNDMFGILAPANIRLGANYSFTDNLTIGIGITKDNRLLDFNAKVALIRQTRKNTKPFSLTFYGNIAVDSRPQDRFFTASDKVSLFSQLIIAKRFSRKFSLQVAPSYSHFNIVESTMNNDHISIAIGSRYKVTDGTAILIDYTQPITQHDGFKPKAGLSTGFEFVAGLHIFQVFFSTNRGILPQQNHMFNQNDIGQADFLFGFNITRMWKF